MIEILRSTASASAPKKLSLRFFGEVTEPLHLALFNKLLNEGSLLMRLMHKVYTKVIVDALEWLLLVIVMNWFAILYIREKVKAMDVDRNAFIGTVSHHPINGKTAAGWMLPF